MIFGRGGGIRTHDLAVPIGVRYQAALHPAKISIDTAMLAHGGIDANAALKVLIKFSCCSGAGADIGQCGKCCFIGFRQSMEISFGGHDTGMT